MWFNKDGKDYTLQFFFEDMPVCSFESFLRGTQHQRHGTAQRQLLGSGVPPCLCRH